MSHAIADARELLLQVNYSERDLFTIAQLTGEMEVDGHRADIVILKAAMAHAAFAKRTCINMEDILVAAELALPHRLKRQSLPGHGSPFAGIDRAIGAAAGRNTRAGMPGQI